jgi:hypothetical protein
MALCSVPTCEVFGQPVEEVLVVDGDVTPRGRVRVLVGFRLEDRGYDAFDCARFVYDVWVLWVDDAGNPKAFVAAEVALELESGCSWFGFFFRGDGHAAHAGAQTVDV